ncbi:MAG: hypothetical protein Q8L34_05240, partial [Candidatus Woesearchaeota archaeon]|nr:hypothetical protein [Candidatus Woesearchaeota archaeon]
TALKLQRRVRELGTTLTELVNKHTKEGWNLSPLEPRKGRNMNEWRQYSTAARTAVRRHIKDLRAIHKAHPDCSVEQHLQENETDSRFIQETYTVGLETFLTQCSMDEETVDLPQLIQTVGIPISETAVNRALINHIKRNYERQDARKVLENAQKAGISITLNDKQIQGIGEGVLICSEESLYYLNALYLKALIGERAFPPGLQEVVQGRSMARLGSDYKSGYFDIEMYDKIQSLLSIKRPATAGEAHYIKKNIIAILTDGREELLKRKQAEAIRDRAGIILTATPTELEVMIDKYFEGGSNAEHPNNIARFFNAQLSPEQIRRRYAALLKDESIQEFGRITYAYTERIEAVQRLMNDTGIKYEPKDLQQMVEAEVNGDDSGAWPRWGPLLGLLTTHNVPPEQSTATRIYQASIQALSGLNERGYLKDTERHLPEIVRRLREFNLPVGDSIAEEVKNLGLKEHGLHNVSLIRSMAWLHHMYQRADVLTPKELAEVADTIDKSFTTDYLSTYNRNATLIEDISFVYAQANRQMQANEIATSVYKRITTNIYTAQHPKNIFPLYAYCAITGARPALGSSELTALKADIAPEGSQHYKFLNDQREDFVKMIDSWIGAAA